MAELLRGIDIKDFGFEYCYKPFAAGDPYNWEKEWEEPQKIPRGVKITAGKFNKTVFMPAGELGTTK